MRYLCNKYLPADNTFYPRNSPLIRAQIEQKIDFYHRYVRPGARAFYAFFLAQFQGMEAHFVKPVE